MNKYPGVCSHGYYHDVEGTGPLSPLCASLLHSLNAETWLHDSLSVPCHRHTNPHSQTCQGHRCFPLHKNITGAGLFSQGWQVLNVPHSGQTFVVPALLCYSGYLIASPHMLGQACPLLLGAFRNPACFDVGNAAYLMPAMREPVPDDWQLSG